MIDRLLTHLKQRWQGPAIDVVVGSKSYHLGAGKATTEVIIHDPRVLHPWSLGLSFGEAYMQGNIKVRGELLDLLQGYYLTSNTLTPTWLTRIGSQLRQITTRTGVSRAVANARAHYDLGNDFYKLWLDPALVYSCAYFLEANDTLAAAQQQKLELLCRKVRLQRGQTLLDIGCGWGGLLFHAAEKYDARVTGITPAKEQAVYITHEIKRRGLEGQVEVIVGDWRQLRGTFDRIISVGMFEHVGRAQYPAFFEAWHTLLKNGGISLLHTIGHGQSGAYNPWLDKYIFPGGYLPTIAELTHHATERHFLIADAENLWQHYAQTLAWWSKNFLAARADVVAMYDESFARMWWLYLQGSEAAFRWGGLQLWQVVLLKSKEAPWPLDREVQLDPVRAKPPGMAGL